MPKKLTWNGNETPKPHYEHNIVEIEGENPAQDRKGRYALNATEREIMRIKEVVAQWTPGKNLGAVLKDLGHPLNNGEVTSREIERLTGLYPMLMDAMCARVAERDLDFAKSWRESEIAEELGLNANALKRLRRSEEFVSAYNVLFGERRRDPRLRATEEKLVDMLPDWVNTLHDMIVGKGVSDATRLGALKLYQSVVDIKVQTGGDDDAEEWKKMLMGANVETLNINFQVPPEYAKGVEVFEGEVRILPPQAVDQD